MQEGSNTSNLSGAAEAKACVRLKLPLLAPVSGTGHLQPVPVLPTALPLLTFLIALGPLPELRGEAGGGLSSSTISHSLCCMQDVTFDENALSRSDIFSIPK